MFKPNFKKISLTRFLTGAGTTGIILGLVIIFFSVVNIFSRGVYVETALSASIQPASDVIINNYKAGTSGVPASIKISKINVNVYLESVGLTSQGAVGVPREKNNAAWFNLGPRPGDVGNAIIVGHYGYWQNGAATVFNNLYKLRKGDKIDIKDGKGAIITFVVRELRTYSENDDVTDVFVSSDNQAHLNLITCQGAWNKFSKSYPKRLVVFADQEVK